MTQISLQNRKKLTDLEIKLVVAWGKMEGWGKGQGVWDGHVQSTLFKMDDQQIPTVQHMELSSML